MTNKYNARRERQNGHNFDSQAEASRYQELRLLESAGEITDLRVHPRFVLQDKFTDSDGCKHQAIIYEADFSYRDAERGQTIVEDVKGVETQLWRVKRKLFLCRHPLLKLRVINLHRKIQNV